MRLSTVLCYSYFKGGKEMIQNVIYTESTLNNEMRQK